MKSKGRRLSIQLKMAFIFASLTAIVVILLAFFGMQSARTAVIEKVELHLFDKANDAATILDIKVGGWFDYLEGVASQYVLHDDTVSYLEKAVFLKKLADDEPRVLGFDIIDTKGNYYLPDGRIIDVSSAQYFKDSEHGTKRFFSEPFPSFDTGELIIVIVVPIVNKNNKIKDFICAFIDGYVLCDYVEEITVGEKGSCYIMNKTGVNLAFKDRELVKNRFSTLEAVKDDPSFADAAAYNKMVLEHDQPLIGYFEFQGSSNIACSAPSEILGWKFVVQAPVKEFLGTLDFLRQKIIIISFVLMFVSIVVVFIGSRSIVLPISRTAKALQNIAEGEGDLTVRLPVTGNDELTDLQLYFNQTIEKIGGSVKGVGENTEAMEIIANDLVSNMDETSSAIHQISKNIESVKAQTITQSTSVTETVATMEEIIRTITNLNSNIESQASSVAQSSASIEEMVQGIAAITDQLNKNSQSMEELSAQVQAGRQGATLANNFIQQVAEKSDSLNETANVIQSIASQTNLLAMNAAIEAAHAGEAGKGFAVVADEIRKLAEESNTQGKQISDMINETLAIISDMAKAGKNAENTFASVYELAKQIAEREISIVSSMQEQDKGNREVLKAISSINDVTNEVNAGSSEMLRGGKQVATEMRKLDELTHIISNSMNEMASGAIQISKAIQEVNEITQKNKDAIIALNNEVGKFKF